ncbi:MAG TPA: O-antigen ligase family protein [Clostridiales bacterium]|nr:O-antigen ligase family protein [Clostridiales bacterium]
MNLNKLKYKFNRINSDPLLEILLVLIFAVTTNTVIYLNLVLHSILAISAIAALFFIFADYSNGLVLMVFLIPLDSASVIIPGLTLTKVIGIVTVISFLISNIKHGIKLPDISLTAFLLYAAASIAWSIDIKESFNRITNLANYYVMVIMIINSVNPITSINSIASINSISTNKNLIKYMNAYLCGSIVVSCLGIYNFITSGGSQRVAAFYGENMNFYGLTIGIAIILSLYLFKNYVNSGNKILKGIYLAACLVLILGQLVSLSRTAWVATCISSFVFFTSSKFNIKRVIISIITLVVIVSVPLLILKRIVPVSTDLFLNRFTTIFTLSDNAAGRLDIWKVAFNIFKDYLFFGVGISNFPAAFTYGYIMNSSAPLDVGLNSDPHNLYISISVELGITGMLIFLFTIYNIFRNIFSLKENGYKEFCMVLMLFLLVAGLTSTILYKKYFWYVLSLVYAIINQINESEKAKGKY